MLNRPTVYTNEHADRLNLEEALRLVSPQRREQALRFRHDEGRRLSVAAYLLLWQGLQERYGMTEHPVLGYGPDGKPHIEGRPDICFNLSHSRHVAVCAVGPQPVGIDVEVVRPLRDALARYVLSEAEYRKTMDSERPEWMFARLWTQKEALLKLSGTGITNHMQHVLDNLSPDIIFETTEGDDYVCTVSYYHPSKRNRPTV